ncbi:hypothetical protein HPB48_007925 [Haemaphysalis longicornis]|uniref:Cytochrome P450 n=1 Tax=Haemaphysalis longicornis TaxID=44386 RepID=A0A9J6FBC1_HAELO|nr:hypothetical protein HPB48_007925 [Haemaphysalis longicornis]
MTVVVTADHEATRAVIEAPGITLTPTLTKMRSLPIGEATASAPLGCGLRNKAVYTDPEMFIPERFLPENSAKIPPFAFLPFSGGVHPCLGQKFGYAQSRVVLATVFSKYSVESTLPLEELSLGFEVSLRAKEKLNVKFRRRNL